MDKRPTPSEPNDGPFMSDPPMSGPSDIEGQLKETATPPIFSQYAEADFPDVGELPVPNLSPMTAHVNPLPFRMVNSSFILPFYADFVLCMRPSNRSPRKRMGKLKKYNVFWFVLKHDIFNILRCLMTFSVRWEIMKALRNLLNT